jgi:hypothetical protein
MRIWGRVGQVNGKGGTWVVVTTDANGLNDAVRLTNLAQVLKLNLNEDPFFANYGIPGEQSVMSQVQPDYYANVTQAQFAGFFAALLVSKSPQKPNQPKPTYAVNMTPNIGAILVNPVPT